MQPASKPIKTEVKFYELTPKTDSSKARVSPPNTKIVQQLGLGDDPNARIEFEYRGTDIYAKAQTAPKRAKLSWGAHRRSRNRKDAARLALSRLSLRELDKEAASQAFMTLFADMVKGTSQAHAAGVMHLDLKPENFFVDENAELQLGDYGTARRTLADTMKSPTDSPEYSAPELINAIKKPALMTWQADVWSLGVMLYEMNSPREGDREHPPSFLPFPYQDRFTSQAAGHINVFCGKANKDDRIEQLNLVEMNPPLRELIIQMLDPDPAKRPSLEEVIANPLVAPYANPITPNEQALVANARQFILELAELHLAT